MSRYFDLRTTVLIVVGHGILAEEEDRPIAYELKREINRRANGSEGHAGVVVTDVWFMNHELQEFFPAIAVGGPAVNGLTEDIHETLPIALSRDESVFVQVDDDSRRAALWGTDRVSTRAAVDAFVGEGWLERFLDLVWRRP